MHYVIKASTTQSDQLYKSAASREGAIEKIELEGRKDRKKEEMAVWTEGRRGQETGRKWRTEGRGWRKAIKDIELANENKERGWENMGRWLKFLREGIESRADVNNKWSITKERRRTCWGKLKKLTYKWHAGFLSFLKLNPQEETLCFHHLRCVSFNFANRSYRFPINPLYYCFRRDQLWWEWEFVWLPVHNKSWNA